MKALVLYEKKDGATELREVPKPSVGPDDVLIRVKAAAVCGADIEFYRAKMTGSLRPPVILGHEFCGVVEEAGRNVKKWKPGDRVVSENTGHVCGECYACLTGQYLLCPERKGTGYSMDGGFAEFVKIPGEVLQRMSSALYRLPDTISFEEGSIMEPSCNAYRAVIQEGELALGEFIAVFGPGPIGLFAVALAKLAGASHIFLFGTAGDETRLTFGKEIGADIVARVDERSASEVISQFLGTDGVDIVIDAAGPGVVMENAMTIIRPLGRIVKVGWGKPYPQLFDPLMVKGATITGHFGYDYVSWRNIIHLVQAGRLHYGSFISKTYSLDQWEEAFVAVEEKKVIKVVFNQF